MDNKFRFGVLDSPPDERDHIVKFDVDGLSAPTSFVAKTIPKYPKYQRSNDCVACALSSILECFLKEQTGRWYTLSSGFIYGNKDYTTNQASGMVIRDALRFVNHDGDVRVQEFDGRQFDYPEIVDYVSANRDWLTPRGIPQAITEYIRADVEIANEFKLGLAKYQYAIVSIPIFADDSILHDVYVHNSDEIVGRHAIMVYGYNDKGYLFLNSWGKNWGENGHAILPYNHQINEAWYILPNDNLGQFYSDGEDSYKPQIPAYGMQWDDVPNRAFEGEIDTAPEPPKPVEPEKPVEPPKPSKKEYKGIDVSKHQGAIDWKKVKSDGVDFAIIRAGFTHYTGGLTVDEYFEANVKAATANGIDIGAYVYSYDHSTNAAKIAAKKFLELIQPYKFTYPIIFDMEYEPFNKTTGKGKLNTDICIAFLEELEKAGYYSMLYCSTDFFKNYLQLDRLTSYDKWSAQYSSVNTMTIPYGIWQYSSKGKVSGVNGNCDMNRGYKDYPTIIRKAKLNHLGDLPVKPIEPPKPVEKLYRVRIGDFEGTKMIEIGHALAEFLKLGVAYNGGLKEYEKGKWRIDCSPYVGEKGLASANKLVDALGLMGLCGVVQGL